MEGIWGKVLIYSVIGMACLTLISPFIDIPLLDPTLENFNKKHPIFSGAILAILGSYMFYQDIKDGHSIKSFRIGDRIRDLLIVGVGVSQINDYV